MSSREPMWFCHECHAEMRPLMVPDPQCASCHGSFVEKMENEADDPREFQHNGTADLLEPNTLPAGIDSFFLGLQGLMERNPSDNFTRTSGSRRLQPSQPPRSNSVDIPGPDRTSSDRRTRELRTPGGFIRVTSSNTPGGRNTVGSRPSGDVPTVSEFLRRNSQADGPEAPAITGPMMAQYLMALLGQRGGGLPDPLAGLFALGMGENTEQSGRWGDYVFNQEALDQLVSQLMETSNAGRPVPATEEIIANLPREVLEVGSDTLAKDCAVCKDQFTLQTEDPEEQVVVTLPCKHPFHEGCIIPWLKSSGTCPVCRHALIPQPQHHTPGPGPGGSDPGSGSNNSSSPRRPDNGSQDTGGLMGSLFTFRPSGSSNDESSGSSSTSRHTRTNSDPGRSGGSQQNNDNFPGGWNGHWGDHLG